MLIRQVDSAPTTTPATTNATMWPACRNMRRQMQRCAAEMKQKQSKCAHTSTDREADTNTHTDRQTYIYYYESHRSHIQLNSWRRRESEEEVGFGNFVACCRRY